MQAHQPKAAPVPKAAPTVTDYDRGRQEVLKQVLAILDEPPTHHAHLVRQVRELMK